MEETVPWGGYTPYACGHKTHGGFFMKKSKLFLVGILASALVFALVLAGCGDEETGDPAGVGGGGPSVTISGDARVGATLTVTFSGLSADQIGWEETNAAGDTKNRDLSDFDDNNTYLVTNNELGKYIRAKVLDYSTLTSVYSSAIGPITN
jgi:hypothetical protein